MPGSTVYTHMKINTSAAIAIRRVITVTTGPSHGWSLRPSQSRIWVANWAPNVLKPSDTTIATPEPGE